MVHVYALRILWICAIYRIHHVILEFLECLTGYRMAHILWKGCELQVCSLCHSGTHHFTYHEQDHCLCSYTLDSSSSSSQRKRTSVIEGGNTRLRKEEEPGVRVQKPEELEVLTQNFISVNEMYSNSLSEFIYMYIHVHVHIHVPSLCNVCMYVHRKRLAVH